MAITAFTSPVSGLWPFGQIVVTTAGTPVALNINIGAQTQTSGHATGAVRQLILTAPAGNTGPTYLLRKVVGQTVTAANTNFIVAVINPGQEVNLPLGLMLSAAINPDDYLVDAGVTGSGNSIIATGVVG